MKRVVFILPKNPLSNGRKFEKYIKCDEIIGESEEITAHKLGSASRLFARFFEPQKSNTI
jgi:hypothetical protein